MNLRSTCMMQYIFKWCVCVSWHVLLLMCKHVCCYCVAGLSDVPLWRDLRIILDNSAQVLFIYLLMLHLCIIPFSFLTCAVLSISCLHSFLAQV